ncbi:MAG TPA: 2-C-methyl-D-erythritol 2,4-cyclodiphosphate synthase [Elusimicrobiota bacterium]|nr:2-C-methyl-D-erythritol 2,4-cyclodiphosphate synthase [Elusimicrobiota bacterium]
MSQDRVRVGWGYDSHRFVKGRRLVLGGVVIPHRVGLQGHSDADAVIHAVIDALLGAAAYGDIGTLFPDSDPAYREADSQRLLKDVVRRIQPRFQIGNVDVTVITQEPKLGPYKSRMRVRLSRLLSVPLKDVSVKAKTNEGMGFIGRGQGLAAVAVAVLSRKKRKGR